MAAPKPRKLATDKQRRDYITAIQEKRSVPTGFIFDGVNVYVDDGIERYNDGVGHGYYATVAAVPVEAVPVEEQADTKKKA